MAVVYWINVYIHTSYIIVHYTPLVKIIDLVSHTTHVVCVSFMHLLSEFLPEICWEEIVEKTLLVFCFDVWSEVRILILRSLSQHTSY